MSVEKYRAYTELIKGLNDSLSNVMKSDIMSLLDHVAFEIKTINEK